MARQTLAEIDEQESKVRERLWRIDHLESAAAVERAQIKRLTERLTAEEGMASQLRQVADIAESMPEASPGAFAALGHNRSDKFVAEVLCLRSHLLSLCEGSLRLGRKPQMQRFRDQLSGAQKRLREIEAALAALEKEAA